MDIFQIGMKNDCVRCRMRIQILLIYYYRNNKLNVFIWRSIVSTIAFPVNVTQIDRLHFNKNNNNKKLSHRFSSVYFIKILPFNETWQMRLSLRLLFPYHCCLLLSLNKNTSRICFSMAIKIIIANVYLLLFASCCSANTRAIILLVQFMNFILCQ